MGPGGRTSVLHRFEGIIFSGVRRNFETSCGELDDRDSSVNKSHGLSGW
jgi:hypothetical protein